VRLLFLNCPNCGKEIKDEEASYCPFCGKRLKEEISAKEKIPCPNCGTIVSKNDVYCRKCGTKLSEPVKEERETITTKGAPPTEEEYGRKFSLIQRFYKLLLAPSETMKDIALAPSYEGMAIIAIGEVVLLSIAAWIILQKIQFSGAYSETIVGLLSAGLVLSVFIGLILFVVRWMIKSLIVKYGCDSGSGWDFRTAASITGYAYIADIIIGILGVCVGWFLLPTCHIDTTNLETARQSVGNYEAQLTWLILLYTLPLELLQMFWKSYLGGLGAHFGTKKLCPLRTAVAVFFVLSLIGFIISFVF
jgi:endogenous inhibitor of DNA gyrase (YacG/DUF329 family)